MPSVVYVRTTPEERLQLGRMEHNPKVEEQNSAKESKQKTACNVMHNSQERTGDVTLLLLFSPGLHIFPNKRWYKNNAVISNTTDVFCK